MKAAISIFIASFVLFLLVMDKKRVKSIFEFISIYWFRLAFSFLALFILNVVAGFFGVYVPVNIVSGLVITILGIPGLASICVIAFIL
ncbi:pro-sigmaK processing inhibitor BofA family protein [Sporosarcina pasteurii]|uniref:Pro-sigmaK processing inhibitor BofA n=1 Tax=Sporosarcina pasteurii TaxID=1474 RepID=A0A380BBF6_SPOPA|nr:pro-sigmaK processing inhibitor BofA family protein [Sporosarcina pasteurii]MDS9473355.1 pro-sigmaK processing inhibitor BofA family protein [Sporosarcina pasteurii]QBQ06545.1 pro-sigmaK processing inhibitor BofA [Sporosarcina pasteurii]SUI98060.1 pro-sigmaK processing inhibitor BofA [Sporosarcina pasteurii]